MGEKKAATTRLLEMLLSLLTVFAFNLAKCGMAYEVLRVYVRLLPPAGWLDVFVVVTVARFAWGALPEKDYEVIDFKRDCLKLLCLAILWRCVA